MEVRVDEAVAEGSDGGGVLGPGKIGHGRLRSRQRGATVKRMGRITLAKGIGRRALVRCEAIPAGKAHLVTNVSP